MSSNCPECGEPMVGASSVGGWTPQRMKAPLYSSQTARCKNGHTWTQTFLSQPILSEEEKRIKKLEDIVDRLERVDENTNRALTKLGEIYKELQETKK